MVSFIEMEKTWVNRRGKAKNMLDWARVSELQSDLGADDFEEIVALFMEEVEECLDQLTSNNNGKLAEHLHFLKGSAANLGFRDMHLMCEQLEVSRDEREIPRLKMVYSASKDALASGLTNLAS